MDDKFRESRRVQRSNSTLSGSFKMAESLLLAGGGNKKIVNLTIANIKLADKSEYKKQQQCQVCFISFRTLTRQHHCRICSNAVCSSCSASSINKQRACDICAYHYSNPDKQVTKMRILDQLKGISIFYAQNKYQIEEQLKNISDGASEKDTIQLFQKSSSQKLQLMKQQLGILKAEREATQEKIRQLQNN